MPPNPVRIRSHDTTTNTHELKRKRKQCRKTIVVGETQFRCDINHTDGLTTHAESGIMIHGQTVTHYRIVWDTDPEPKVIRHPQEQHATNN
jgi:hypothetical protein